MRKRKQEPVADIDATPRFPHCDSNVLHAPAPARHVGTLVGMGYAWRLSFHPIEEAPKLPVALSTSRRDRALRGMSLLVIPLTQPASNALVSLLPENPLGEHQRQGFVIKTGASIEVDGAQLASLSDAVEYRPLSDELNWPKPNGLVLPLPERTFARQSLSHAQIVIPVFRGTSWSLTIGTDEGWRTQQFPLSLGKEPWNGLSLKSLSAIWSALTATKSALTTERWQQESVRRSGECVYCDGQPGLQALREELGINFTGQHDPDKEPCPAEVRRKLETINLWPGNVPRTEPVKGVEFW